MIDLIGYRNIARFDPLLLGCSISEEPLVSIPTISEIRKFVDILEFK